VIEYALIGASVALIMSYHIGSNSCQSQNGDQLNGMSSPYRSEPNRVRTPNPKRYMQKLNCNNSLQGVLCGLLILLVAVTNLGVFFGLIGYEHTKDDAEMISKCSNTIINVIGIIACLWGIITIQQLRQKGRQSHLAEYLAEEEGYNLDDTLLRFGAFFVFVYNNFTIISGSFMQESPDFPYQVHIANGIVEILQVILQIIFLHNLNEKVLPQELKSIMPGRQICIFMFLFNISQWLVFTFEVQKVRASLSEADFYGFMPWVIIRRVTLPLVVFFRFHSSVVSIELWKRVYTD